MMETPRQKWMQILADADAADLKAGNDRFGENISFSRLIPPETGMVMVQARADGAGAPFCLGEMTVTRCMVQVLDNIQGYAMVPGSDHDHAELAALFDALLQMPSFHDRLMATLMADLKTREKQRQLTMGREISDTTVEFFTLRRGE
ncbi:MAG TPA: phosphonate C-P lyase system protein PhnG [Desulfotignum sp.]|jgi:alpha-D-ribose 1-methylphosphonate 5-triphosphate synthase subunit PhnG|nr:phosphonate C-P lyase system protein PhnG [Desulfotignum sp.]